MKWSAWEKLPTTEFNIWIKYLNNKRHLSIEMYDMPDYIHITFLPKLKNIKIIYHSYIKDNQNYFLDTISKYVITQLPLELVKFEIDKFLEKISSMEAFL